MLTIREAQIRAMAEHDLGDFRGLVVRLLCLKHPAALGMADPEAYAGRLFDLALSRCTGAGFDDQGSVIDFAESLVKNDAHPLDAQRLADKAQAILREFRSRAVHLRLQSLAAALAPPPDAADDDDAPTQE